LDFVDKLRLLLTSCDDRRLAEYEPLSWWDFTDANNKSKAFQKFLGNGLTRSLVAAQGREMSARTGGLIFCQLMFGLLSFDDHVDRVLDGPTSEVWIDPWINYLRDKNVELHNECELAAIHCDKTGVKCMTVQRPNGDAEHVTADYYVLCWRYRRSGWNGCSRGSLRRPIQAWRELGSCKPGG